MHNIDLFVEDFGHEVVLKALVERVALQQGVSVTIRPKSVRGGHGKMMSELKQFVREIIASPYAMPDLLVVGRDANCKGFNVRRRELEVVTQPIADRVALAIPDPHIERWLLLDSSAFKQVLGTGCNAPGQKCERDRYKLLLQEAVRNADLTPLLGGMEHSEALINHMDLEYVSRVEPSFAYLLTRIHEVFKSW
jgi:hypothetical protein